MNAFLCTWIRRCTFHNYIKREKRVTIMHNCYMSWGYMVLLAKSSRLQIKIFCTVLDLEWEREVSLKLLSCYQVDCRRHRCFFWYLFFVFSLEMESDKIEYCPRKGVRSQGAVKLNSIYIKIIKWKRLLSSFQKK